MSAFTTDGTWTSASAVGKPRKTFPFEGDNASYYVEQDFMMLGASFAPLALDTVHAAIAACYLVGEGPHQDLGADVIRWTRRYAKIPAARDDYESFAARFPGKAPSGTNARTVISTATTSGTSTTFVTTAAHGLSVGDEVALYYAINLGSRFEINSEVIRKVTAVADTTNFSAYFRSNIRPSILRISPASPWSTMVATHTPRL